MRITLDLPEYLIEEAMKVTHINTKTKVIITALEDLITKTRISELKKFKGKVNLDMNLNAIRGCQSTPLIWEYIFCLIFRVKRLVCCPRFKKRTFRKKCTEDFTRKELAEIEEVYTWLKSMLPS